MVTLEQVKDVPFLVRVKETNSYIREIPFNEQAKKASQWIVDFDKLAYHALHNHYCISFIECPFSLNFESIFYHFDWCSRYLYFNFEESVLLIEIFTKLEKLNLQAEKLYHLVNLLEQYPQAYQYNLDDSDHKQKWALLKKSKFQKNCDFLKLIEIDKRQRTILLEHLRILQGKVNELLGSKIDESVKNAFTVPKKRTQRESSSYNYLKLSDELSVGTSNEVINFLYTTFQPFFRIPYNVDTFSKIFSNEASPVLELIKKDHFDNQSLKIIFQALKEAKGLVVSWQVIEKKVRVFKANGIPFSSFSEVSMGKISPKKRKQQEKDMSPVIELIKRELAANKRK